MVFVALITACDCPTNIIHPIAENCLWQGGIFMFCWICNFVVSKLKPVESCNATYTIKVEQSSV